MTVERARSVTYSNTRLVRITLTTHTLDGLEPVVYAMPMQAGDACRADR